MTWWLRDLRYGLRVLGRRPAYTVTALLTLALGIGGTTAVFGLVNAVLIRPLPFGDPDRIAMVWEDASASGFPKNEASPRDYFTWVSERHIVDGIAAAAVRGFTLTGGNEPEKIQALAVTPSFFGVLGVEPSLGRSFRDDEKVPGADRVVVLSDGLWRRRFGADRSVVGDAVILDGERYTIVGVMPRGFQFLESYIGLWVPLALSPEEMTSDAHYLDVVVRLAPGARRERAEAALDTITRRAAVGRAEQSRTPRTYLVPLRDELVGDVRQPLLVLLAAVASVLLIACANLAGLLLARAASRGREFAIRSALGASRGRVVRQLLTESALLAIVGAAPALLVASLTLDAFRELVPAGVQLSADPRIDPLTLAFMAAISVLAAIFGLAPAMQVARLASGAGLQQRGAAYTDVRTRRLRGGLVVAEVAATLMLLVVAGLFIKTLYHLRFANLGLRPDGVLTLRTSLPFQKYGERARRIAFYDEVLDRVSHLPGVAAAGYTTTVPLEWKGGTTGITIEGRPRDPGVTYEANHRQVSVGYLQTIGISLGRGRYFDPSDTGLARRVAIVNETMARQYWPDDDAVGRRFKVGDPDADGPWLTIVGIVGDVRQMGLDRPVKAEMYLPYAQVAGHQWFAPRDLVVRVTGTPLDAVAAIVREVHAVDPDEPVSNIRTLDAVLDEHAAGSRLQTTLMAAFAVLALLLAATGVYGLLSHFVAEHLPEIGVRMALGAQRGDIVWLVVGRGLLLSLVGAAIGAVGALAATTLIANQLYLVDQRDPSVFLGATVVLVSTAALASFLPAQRATRLDPVATLRAD